MLDVEKVYVVHYTRLIERRMRLEGQFRRLDIEAEYITADDKDDLSAAQIKESYVNNEESYNNTILKVYGKESNPFRRMSDAEISCTIKHYNAIKKIGEECEEYGLIFEDDVILVDNFVDHFNSYLKRTPTDWDAIFMGSCCDLRISPPGGDLEQVAFLKKHPATKCADGYMLKRGLAQKITKTMMPFNVISDWELGYQLALHGANVYWWEPPLLYQGSESGLFQSTLECARCKRRGCNGDC